MAEETETVDFLLEKEMDSQNLSEKDEGTNISKPLDILAAIKEQMDLDPMTSQAKVEKPEKSPKEVSSFRKNPPYYESPDTIFFEKDKKKIKELLSTKNKKDEIEASLGTFNNKYFYPGVKSLFHLNRLKWNLKNYPGPNKFTEETSNDRVDSIKDHHVRRIQNLDVDAVSYEKKFRYSKDNIDNNLWGIRFSRSSEVFVVAEEFDGDKWEKIEKLRKNPIKLGGRKLKELGLQRYRTRSSFKQASKRGEFYGLIFDLTVVREIKILENGKEETLDKYEVEIEKEKEINVSYETFTKAIRWALEKLQDVSEDGQLMDLKEKMTAVVLHNNLFSETLNKEYKDPYRLYGGYRNKPVNVKVENMLDSRFNPHVTIKMDGKRYSLLFSMNGTYMFSPPYDILKIGPGNKQFNGTLVDCEFIQVYDEKKTKPIISRIYGFDLLFYKGMDFRSDNFSKRFGALQKVNDSDGKLFNIDYQTKVYYSSGEFYDRTKEAFKDIKKNPEYEKYHMVDGLIFQPKHWYKNRHTFKWKDINDLTIDFQLLPMKEEHISEKIKEEEIIGDISELTGRIFWTVVGGGKIFNGTKTHPYEGFSIFDSDKFEDETLSYKVVECKWNKEREEFEPYRIRDDRDRPNNLDTAIDVWNDIMRPIPKQTIEGETLQLMRRYHNMEKMYLLSRNFSKGSKILDIGSGRGGDLQKWGKAGIKTVYAIEPNESNLEEFKNRKNSMNLNTNVYIVNKGAEETQEITELLEKNKDTLDGIVSFFSLTFFPQSKKLYDSLLETIDLVNDGGKFIGIVLDGMKVRKLLDDNRLDLAKKGEPLDDDEPSEYETKAYTISQDSFFDDEVTGNSIEINLTDPTSMVKGQKEWLFYFEPFRKELEKRGFKLIHQDFLDKGDVFDMLPESSRVFSRLNRKFVFQKISKKQDVSESLLSPKFNVDDLTVSPVKKDKKQDIPKKIPEIQVGGTSELHTKKYGNDLNYLRVEPGASNFVHAILRAISNTYNNMDKDERNTYVSKIRQVLARKMDMKMFKSLHSGDLAKILQYHYLEDYEEKDALELAYLEFKLRIMDSINWIGESSLLEIASMVLGIDIYVLEYKRNGKNDIGPSSIFSKDCDMIYVNKKAIVLFTTDSTNYNVVFRNTENGMQTMFDTNSKLIKDIKKGICH